MPAAMGDSDLLSYLNVKIPTDVPPTITTTESSASNNEYRILKPKQSPLTAVDAVSSSQQKTGPRGGYSTYRGRGGQSIVLRGEPQVVRKRQKDGTYIDYELYDAAVPSIVTYNQTAATERAKAAQAELQQRQEQERKEMAQREEWLKTLKETHARARAIRFAQCHQSFSLYETERAEKVAEDLKRKQKDREMVQQSVEREIAFDKRVKENQRAQVKKWCEIATRELEQRTVTKQQAVAEERELSAKSMGSLLMPARSISVDAIARSRESMLHSWKEQIAERAKREAEERARTHAVAQQLQELEQKELQRIADKAAEVRKQRLEAHPWESLEKAVAARVQEAEAARQQAYQKRMEEDAARKAIMEKARVEVKTRQQQLMSELQKRMEVRQQELRMQHQSEIETDRKRAQQLQEATIPRKILLKCPVTGQYLPPDCFQITTVR